MEHTKSKRTSGFALSQAVRTSPSREDRHGKGKLSRQCVLLLIVHGLFATANALSGAFVNVFLWKAKNDFAMLGWFALAGQIAGAVTFYFAGKWVKEHNKMNSLRLGVAVSAVFYMLVLLLGERSIHYVFVLGLVLGTASGFFWLAFNVVYFEVTDPDNRDRFNGWSGLLGSASGMIAPFVSGLIIAGAGGGKIGYRIVFSLSLAVFLIGVVVSFFLKKRKVNGTYSWRYGFQALKVSRLWKRAFAGLVAQGVREGVFVFIIGVLIFIATSNESKVGSFSLITSAVGLISYWILGKMLKPRHRDFSMLAGGILMVAAIVPFFWKVNYATLLLFGIIAGLAFPLYIIPITSSVFDLIGRDEDSAEHRVEFVVLRELGLIAGRMLGVIAYLVVVSVDDAVRTMNLLLLAIGSSPLWAWWFIRGIIKNRFAGSGNRV